VRHMFQAEANLMAQLSSHPSILTVYQASVSADGRPYLVMELCSASLSARYRTEKIPVPEVLRIAVKIGSAIETAHRAGVLHRDIKPSNILMTAYGHPVLSDFGIAATLSETDSQEMVGMSIPWSAPEVLMDETPGSVRAEVWSLAATVYSLLAGRSPFEIPGESNTSSDLISRINRAKPQPIGRSDVPASLERTLAVAMSRKPENRPASVLELVRAFQAVETELGVPQTPIEVAMDDWALATVSDLEDRTRIKGVAGAIEPANPRRRRRRPTGGAYSSVGTVIRETHPSARSAGTRPAGQGRGLRAVVWGLIASAVLVIALGTIAVFVLLKTTNGDIPQVVDISAEIKTGTVIFSWDDPGIGQDDSYDVATTDGGANLQTKSVQRITQFPQAAKPGDHVCIVVTVNRQGKTGTPSSPKCVDVPG